MGRSHRRGTSMRTTSETSPPRLCKRRRRIEHLPRYRRKGTPKGFRVAWGLVAARLGSKRNRGAFRSAFWFDSTRPGGQSTAEGMQTRLSDWGSGKRPHPTWPQARARSEAAQNRVEAAISARRSAQTGIADH